MQVLCDHDSRAGGLLNFSLRVAHRPCLRLAAGGRVRLPLHYRQQRPPRHRAPLVGRRHPLPRPALRLLRHRLAGAASAHLPLCPPARHLVSPSRHISKTPRKPLTPVPAAPRRHTCTATPGRRASPSPRCSRTSSPLAPASLASRGSSSPRSTRCACAPPPSRRRRARTGYAISSSRKRTCTT